VAEEPRAASATALRKMAHIDACLECPVEFQQRTTRLEELELRYTALPEQDLDGVDLATTFLGKRLAAPVLIGAMTGGTQLSGRINENLARAAQALGLGLMLGSQRVMLEDATRRPSFEVRRHAPDVLVLGNLGVAQVGVATVRTAVESIEADGLALHANPLQEAIQLEGDTDFRGLLDRIAEVAGAVPFPLVLKEVGHGIGADVAEAAVAAVSPRSTSRGPAEPRGRGSRSSFATAGSGIRRSPNGASRRPTRCDRSARGCLPRRSSRRAVSGPASTLPKRWRSAPTPSPSRSRCSARRSNRPRR